MKVNEEGDVFKHKKLALLQRAVLTPNRAVV